jgi:hypothetical protein
MFILVLCECSKCHSYRNQTELLDIVKGFVNRGLPISVINVDYYHWINFGDWSFNPACWPDSAGNVLLSAFSFLVVLVVVVVIGLLFLFLQFLFFFLFFFLISRHGCTAHRSVNQGDGQFLARV